MGVQDKNIFYFENFEKNDYFKFFNTRQIPADIFKGIVHDPADVRNHCFKLGYTAMNKEPYELCCGVPLYIPLTPGLSFGARICVERFYPADRGFDVGEFSISMGFVFPNSSKTHIIHPLYAMDRVTSGWQNIKIYIMESLKKIPYYRRLNLEGGYISTWYLQVIDKGYNFSHNDYSLRTVVYIDDVKIESGDRNKDKEYKRFSNKVAKESIEVVSAELNQNLIGARRISVESEEIKKKVHEVEFRIKNTEDLLLKKGTEFFAPTGKTGIRDGKIRRLVEPVRKLSSEIVSALVKEDTARYIIFTRPPITNVKLLPTTKPELYEISSVLKIFACPGEYEPASFSIYAGRKLKDVRVLTNALKTIDGKVISSKAIDVRVVKCWYQAGSWDVIQEPGELVPELLLKDDELITIDTKKQINIKKFGPYQLPNGDGKELKPVQVPANTSKQFWVTVRVPYDAAAGNYHSVLEIIPANAGSKKIDLYLKVLPFHLEKPMLDYAVYFPAVLRKKESQFEQLGFLHPEVHVRTPEQYEADLINLLNHGITNPQVWENVDISHDGSFDFTWLRKALDIRKKVGIGNVPLLFYGKPGIAREIFIEKYRRGIGVINKKWLKRFTDPKKLAVLTRFAGALNKVAREYGYTEVYHYAIDEASHGEVFDAEKPAIEAIHAGGGKVFAACYENFFEHAGEILDLPIIYQCFSAPEKIHRLGHKIYNYANPQMGVEQPYTYRRNYGLWLWQRSLDGTCNDAYHDIMGDPWDDFDYRITKNGKYKSYWKDHMMAYPSRDGVIDTVQWEGWREGVDDVRYLTTLLKTIRGAKRRKEKKEIVNKAERWIRKLKDAPASLFHECVPDEERKIYGDLQKLRWEMVKWILKLQK